DEGPGRVSISHDDAILLNRFTSHLRIERMEPRARVRCMKKLDAFKLSLLATSVAGLGVGCASSGYARMDNDNGASVGAAASTDIGTDRDTTVAATTYDSNRHYNHHLDQHEGAARVTVSALSFVPETRANWVNRFPFYDPNWRMV